jgi:U4/U6 small nuclear ribonucleoprotein PRP3
LTPDQRATKDHERELAYEAKGVFATAYIVRYLVNGRHKFKVRETAKHDLLSGRCLFHRDFALIIVEGVGKKIKHFKQLMTHRIDWTEEARPLGRGSDDEDENNDEDRHKGIAMGAIVEDAPEDTQDAPVDMSQNKCDIVWEGVIPERVFKYFRANHIDTDSKGKDILTEKYEGLWDLAKKWSWDNDDL